MNNKIISIYLSLKTITRICWVGKSPLESGVGGLSRDTMGKKPEKLLEWRFLLSFWYPLPSSP